MSDQEYKYDVEFFNLNGNSNDNDYKCNTFEFTKENHKLDQHFHCPKCYRKEWKHCSEKLNGIMNCSSYQVCPTCRYEKKDTFHKNLSVNEEFIRMIICTPNICASS